jgi:hypothetical protein
MPQLLQTRNLPIKELRERKLLPETKNEKELVDSLLRLFEIGTPQSYAAKVSTLAVHHRKAKAHESSCQWDRIASRRCRWHAVTRSRPSIQLFERFEGQVRLGPRTIGSVTAPSLSGGRRNAAFPLARRMQSAIGLDLDVLRCDPYDLVVLPHADRIPQLLMTPQCLANAASERLLDQLHVFKSLAQ